MNDCRILRVAINAPLTGLFDYRAPDGTNLSPGCRVKVPFGRQTQVGLVLETAATTNIPHNKLKKPVALIDEAPIITKTDLWLIRFTSDYYHHPIGEVVAAAMPALLRQGKPLAVKLRCVAVTDAGNAIDLDELRKRAPKQAELLSMIRDANTISYPTLDDEMPGWRRPGKSLIDKSLIEEFETNEDAAAEILSNVEQEKGPSLNADQRHALETVRKGDGFCVSTIDGVTGSGKTEVYLHLIKDQLAAGRQSLVLVPEIGLTPQLVSRFRKRLGIEPVLLHSALTDAARLNAWRSAADGSAPLILGTRSAVFAPMKYAGLIVVDEEHDSSLKQQEGLRYSARDLSVARGKHLNIPVILGSATPSLDTLQRCREGAYQTVKLPARAGLAVPPLMRLIDLTRYDAVDGLSEPAVAAIEKHIACDGQVLLFLNRRGFAPTLICTGCGSVAECTRCDSRMTVHAGAALLKCHHCGAERTIDTECAECGSLCKPLGQGTERLEDALCSRFPDQIVTRIDSDSTRLKGTMTRALAIATAGETRILVGTQMLSKGHHFPMLSLVVVINADQGLFSTDFRGGERLAQSLIQVSGRAGREAQQGEVIIQTTFPAHPFWTELLSGGYEKVAESALGEREKAVWPPFSRLALVRAAATRRDDAQQFLENARRIATDCNIEGVRILGPVSAPMERKAGRYRAQLLLQSIQRSNLHLVLAELRRSLESSRDSRRVRWSIDVDPIELF